MAKYVVVYSDGSGLKNGGYADKLPKNAYETSPGVFETGSIADGDPTYLLVPDYEYAPEVDESEVD